MKKIILISIVGTYTYGTDIQLNDINFQVGGQIVADTARINDNGHSDHASEIRRARLYLKGDMNKDFSYEITYSFTGNNKWKDVYLKYTGFDNWAILGGNIKEPFGLEALTSSKYNTFMERGLADFYTSRRLGLLTQGYYKNSDNMTTFSLGGFSKSLDNLIDNKAGSHSFVGRATYANVSSKTEMFHLGVGGSYTSYDSKSIKLSTSAGSHLYDGSFIKTKVKNVEHTTRLGIEGAMVSGPFSLQSEYILASLSQKETTYHFNGWYAQLSWFITGESRNYKAKKAAFSRIKPNNPMDKGGYGAIETTFRITQTDLDDKDENGGKARDLTLGINWYLKSNLRLMTDYTYSKQLKQSSKDAKVLQLRAQYDF